MENPRPYSGSARRLILGIDVGTTFSGMSYVLLEPGVLPKVEAIKRYPGQTNNGDYRIPSIVHYRPDGTVHSVGAEADSSDVTMELEFEDLFLSRWFKLHLRPNHLDNDSVNKRNIPPLPPGKTVVDVLSDLLRYMFDCARTYITESCAAVGQSEWDSVKNDILFILTHPNGWEGPQLSMMRQAAIKAGLVPDTPNGQERIQFLTEGEASLHFCVQTSAITADAIKTGERVMIIDAGGGTVDISSYSFKSANPLSVVETCVPDCIMQGSTMVTARAEKFIRDRLQNSPYGDEATIKDMTKAFDKDVKPLFSAGKSRRIKTGVRGSDAKLNITNGSLLVTGDEMETFFRPSFDGILLGIKSQFRSTSGKAISTAILVGGFSGSRWLFDNLKTSLDKMGLKLYRPTENASKAVADGALLHYIHNTVTYHIARTTYGTPVHMRFNLLDPEHRARIDTHKIAFGPVGAFFDNCFSIILAKGTVMSPRQEFIEEYRVVHHKSRTVSEISEEILAYEGSKTDPTWMDDEPEKFKRLCIVRADISNVTEVEKVDTPHGEICVKEVKVILRYVDSELQAQIGWMEDGEEKRGPAQLVYDD